MPANNKTNNETRRFCRFYIFQRLRARACLSFRVFKESLQLFLFFRVYSTCASVRMCVSAHHLCYWMHSLVVGNWCLVGCLSRSMSLPVSIHTYLLSWTICIINSVFSYFFFRALFTTKQSYFNTSYSLSSHATFFFTVQIHTHKIQQRTVSILCALSVMIHFLLLDNSFSWADSYCIQTHTGEYYRLSDILCHHIRLWVLDNKIILKRSALPIKCGVWRGAT